MIKGLVRRLLEASLTRTEYHLVAQGAPAAERAAFVDHVATVMHTLEIDCVFDVGANRGGFRDFLRMEVGYGGLILSFEPVSHLAELIRVASVSDPLWHTFHFAIGDVPGVMPINVARNEVFSSFLQSSDATVDYVAAGNSVDHVEDTTVRTLADVFTEMQEKHGFKRPYLKIDTQGFDLKVLKGAGEYLSRFMAMQTELSMLPIYEDQPSYTQVLAFLTQAGFSISGMYPEDRDPLLRVVEFDCVLIRDIEGAV